jgi:hypothetical protein
MILFKKEIFPDMETFLQHGDRHCKQRYERLCGHRDGKK